MRIVLTLDDRETALLDAIVGKIGGKRQDALRNMIKARFAKEFPAYKGSAQQKAMDTVSMTPEQACEAAGGTVDKNAGVCVLRKVGAPHIVRRIPLEKPHLFAEA